LGQLEDNERSWNKCLMAVPLWKGDFNPNSWIWSWNFFPEMARRYYGEDKEAVNKSSLPELPEHGNGSAFPESKERTKRDIFHLS